MSPVVAGVDGAKGQWLVATVAVGSVELRLVPTFAQVVELADASGVGCMGVDMPIALPESGPRDADLEARRRLGSRRATLFPTPVRATLDALTYADACERSRAVSGKALSKQAWNLMPMVRDLRGAIAGQPADRFIEVHPESTFCALAGVPLPSKKTAAGVGARLQVLRGHVDGLDSVLTEAPADVAIDDALDALAAMISAARFVSGEADVLGAGHDGDGHPLRLVI
ncbi:MAG: DUF429 domain-containing protein [Actinomycetota bacterium]